MLSPTAREILIEQTVDNRDHDAGDRDPDREKTGPDSEFQRHERKRNDSVHREVNHLRERILALTCLTRRARVMKRNLAEAGPTHHAAQEPRALGHRIDHVYHFAIDQTEVTRVERHLRFRQTIDQTVEDLGGPEFETAFPFALVADAVNDFVSFAPELDHLRDYFGWVLQVCIDDHDCRPRGFFEPGRHGDLMSEIARQQQHAHAWVEEL